MRERIEQDFGLLGWFAWTLVAFGLCLLLYASALVSRAAVPSGGTLGADLGSSVSWMGTATGPASPGDEGTCVEGVNCDTYLLTLAPGDYTNKRVRIEINWGTVATDYDLYVHQESNAGPLLASSAQGTTTFEAVEIDPLAVAARSDGTRLVSVHVVYFAATAADQYRGKATITQAVQPAPPSSEPPPQYTNYQSPPGLGDRAGEPSIGVNWLTGRVMFQAVLQTLRVTFDDSGNATWELKNGPNTGLTTLDPILFTDSRTGRTIVSQLFGKTSLSAFTDNDGETYMVSQGAGINSGVDHQTVGGGPFKRCSSAELLSDPVRCAKLLARGPITAYPNAVYYASQDIAEAQLALSRDGGLTYEQANTMYTLVDCGGLHGHIKVGPDGTVYVPNKGCTGKQAVIVSEDNGLTFSIRRVPDSTRGRSDPSVGIGRGDKVPGGRLYFGYTDSSNRPRIAVSDDQGKTWRPSLDFSGSATPFNIQNAVFPTVVAGDDDRAAFFFLGTDGVGDAAGDDTKQVFAGTWYGYIATTYDGGRTWVVVRATDPVQQGVICTNGTTCPSGTRNLLDFNDMTVDRRGRVLAAYADGCITARCLAVRNGTKSDNDKTSKATIIRQSGGKGLFAAFDPSP